MSKQYRLILWFAYKMLHNLFGILFWLIRNFQNKLLQKNQEIFSLFVLYVVDEITTDQQSYGSYHKVILNLHQLSLFCPNEELTNVFVLHNCNKK